MMKNLLVLRHLAFEDLGRLGPLLEQAGYQIQYAEMGIDRLADISPLNHDLVIVLGGPISVYQAHLYPFLTTEIAWLRARLLEDLPTLGICLGAQLIAAALHARVYPGTVGKEIGWDSLTAASHTAQLPYLQQLIEQQTPVLHWHGDTFDLPAGALHLAGSRRYQHQAFSWGRNALALQFHAEFDPLRLEQWLIGHSHEIGHTPGLELAQLRRDTAAYGAASQQALHNFWCAWLVSVAAIDARQLPA